MKPEQIADVLRLHGMWLRDVVSAQRRGDGGGAMTTRPDDPVHPVAGGLTKREYFAALMMQSHAASPAGDHMTAADAATFATVWADALIVALNERSLNEPSRWP